MPHDNPQGYDNWAHVYDALYERAFELYGYRQFTDIHLRLVPEGARRVLDVGAGTGRLSIPLAKRGAQVTALEPSGSMLAQLRQKAAREGVTQLITEVQMGLEDAGTAAAIGTGHDCAICVFTTIHHMPTADSLRAGFRNIASALSPGGTALIGVHAPGFMGRFANGNVTHVHIPALGGTVTWGQYYDQQPGSTLAQARCEITMPDGQRHTDRFPVYPWTFEDVKAAAHSAGLRYTSQHQAMVETVLVFSR